jgi:hypothetical protein
VLLLRTDGVSLFAGEIIKAFSSTDDDNVSSRKAILDITQQNLIGLSMGIPACLLSIYFLQLMSTKSQQIIGFVLIAAMFALMAACFVPLQDGNSQALFAIYCFLLFSLSFGPNLTTYVLPAQTYPKHIRATFNGISAACGKVGAFAGVYMFGSIAQVSTYPTGMTVHTSAMIIVTFYFFTLFISILSYAHLCGLFAHRSVDFLFLYRS